MKLVNIVGLLFETGTSALQLYNNTKESVTICVKSHSNACSARTLLFNVNNYSVFT